jgi:hypothetical protein
MLKRGMGRSSYALQTQANILNQKNQAANRLGEAKIADYQNRIGQIEQQEKEDERWERQFAAGREDAAWQQAFSEKQYNTQNQQWQQNFEAGRSDAAWNQNFQQQQADISNRQWEQNFNAQQDQNAWQRNFSEKQFNAQQNQNAWQQRFSEQQFAAQQRQNDIANQQWEKSFNANQSQQALENAFREKQFSANQEQQAIANQQWEQSFNADQQQRTIQNQQWQQSFNAQQAQWREQFDYNAKSDAQKTAFNVAAQAAALGNDVDDYLLGRAGLTRADFNSMKQQAAAGGYTPIPQNDGDGGRNLPTSDAMFDALVGNVKPATQKTTGLNFSKVYK